METPRRVSLALVLFDRAMKRIAQNRSLSLSLSDSRDRSRIEDRETNAMMRSVAPERRAIRYFYACPRCELDAYVIAMISRCGWRLVAL